MSIVTCSLHGNMHLVLQYSVDDSSRKAVSLDLSSPNSETPNSYLKLSYMLAPPTPSETSSGTQMQSPQTGGDPPTAPPTSTCNGVNMYVNLNHFPAAAKDAPPIPSRGRRTSKIDLTSRYVRGCQVIYPPNQIVPPPLPSPPRSVMTPLHLPPKDGK